MCTRAIVRTPAANAGDGLTTAGLGPPDVELLLAQHDAYVEALASLGLAIEVLEADPRFPDGHFVEDTAVVTPQLAVVARPGAPSRLGEEASVAPVLARYRRIARITEPGSLDGGDVVVAGDRCLVGVSARTDAAGAAQLAAILAEHGMRCVEIPVASGLHLKSSVNYLGEGRLLVAPAFARHEALSGFELVVLDEEEAYAANSLCIDGSVLVPRGFARASERIAAAGLRVVELDASELRKMDGGLTCLSLRL